jgi:8-oxo-dGTP pyrophosphatase MutT (NUDIX family)
MRKRSYWGTSGAGVLAVAEDTGRFLIALRSEKVKEPGTWGTIGGKQDHKESFRETALREFVEETGYDGQLELIAIMDYEDPGEFTYRNFIGVVPYEIELHGNHENEELKWVTFDELLDIEPKHPGLEILLEVTAEALKEFTNEAEDPLD